MSDVQRWYWDRYDGLSSWPGTEGMPESGTKLVPADAYDALARQLEASKEETIRQHSLYQDAFYKAERLERQLAEVRVKELEAEKHYSATIDAETELLPRLQQAEARLAALEAENAKLLHRGLEEAEARDKAEVQLAKVELQQFHADRLIQKIKDSYSESAASWLDWYTGLQHAIAEYDKALAAAKEGA